MVDAIRATELREKIRRQATQRDEAIRDMERARASQTRQAQDAGADQTSLDAIARICDETIARIHAQHDRIVAIWQRELDSTDDA